MRAHGEEAGLLASGPDICFPVRLSEWSSWEGWDSLDAATMSEFFWNQTQNKEPALCNTRGGASRGHVNGRLGQWHPQPRVPSLENWEMMARLRLGWASVRHFLFGVAKMLWGKSRTVLAAVAV